MNIIFVLFSHFVLFDVYLFLFLFSCPIPYSLVCTGGRIKQRCNATPHEFFFQLRRTRTLRKWVLLLRLFSPSLSLLRSFNAPFFCIHFLVSPQRVRTWADFFSFFFIIPDTSVGSHWWAHFVDACRFDSNELWWCMKGERRENIIRDYSGISTSL